MLTGLETWTSESQGQEFVYFLGIHSSAGAQSFIALSSTEAEYASAATGLTSLLWQIAKKSAGRGWI
jgi:hypothetical protein